MHIYINQWKCKLINKNICKKTWAIDAEAIGTLSNFWKRSSIFWWNSSLIIFSISSYGAGLALSYIEAKYFRYDGGSIWSDAATY